MWSRKLGQFTHLPSHDFGWRVVFRRTGRANPAITATQGRQTFRSKPARPDSGVDDEDPGP